ncbi:transposase [Jejuia sp. DST062]|uniref:transposase n=1 Tax=Flavisericum labens TaxID=3377112 RepID=UPI00387A8A2A
MKLQAIKSRNAKWAKDQDGRPGAGNKGSRYTSNKTHYSPTDPDARISVKPGKARKLNYQSQLTVDTAHHVISDIKAYHADGKDNQQLQDIVVRVQRRLRRSGLVWDNCVADTGYSSGENYAFLEGRNLKSFIPPHGTYKGCPDGFAYNEAKDHYVCSQGKVVPFKKVFYETKNHTKKKEYRASKKVCIDCPVRSQCLGKSAQEKKFTVTYYRAEYERNIARVNSPQGRYMKAKRQSTVEPVFGTLTQFMGLRKVNTIGIKQANKCMQLSAIAYNLKKYLKFVEKHSKSGAASLPALLSRVLAVIGLILSPYDRLRFSF